nr:MAG TPA: hypothetical protein [Caudoviricetes sp.]
MIIYKTSKNAYKRKYTFLKHMNSNEFIAVCIHGVHMIKFVFILWTPP